MKKLILGAIFFFGLSATGFSQDKSPRVQKSPEERAQKMTDAMAQKLALTENQKTQIYQINLERAQAMSKFRGAKQEGVDRSQMKTQFEANESRLMSVLNEQQRATYAQLKAQRDAKFKAHKGEKRHHSGDKK
ncbi:DUF4890 domain-containing protein [Paradesertivirga mongoliensis]|uniref:DUF4890 domain-containing protein n=1 Tax=Paradesertivirga mongoliensis TaxID=2100740 RepID=A0ABW4ZLK0_9SPHI|nr:DUF4890 domain-containing protein [Pedobacter mongoliensis]